MAVFSVVGTGPGARDYVLPAAWQEASQADTLLGSPRALENFQDLGKKTLVLQEGGYREAVDYIREHRERERIALLVSGDPGFYSYLAVIRRFFSPPDYRVVPGISSLQLAFSRIGRPWQDVLLLSAHGRSISGNTQAPGSPEEQPLFYLTDQINGPRRIAQVLLTAGMGERIAWVLERLSYPDEKITKTPIAKLAEDNKEYEICVMIVE